MAGAALRLPALRELATAIAGGRLSSRELVEQCLARIDAVEGVVEAWVSVDAEGARAQADRRDHEAATARLRGPLHGIPVAVKDIIDVAGQPTRAGSRSRADAPPATADAAVVALAKAGGAVILGKTHTTEFAGYEKDAPFLGVPPTRNPHAPDHTPGGSSAGSAAAVAAGMVPLALGTQTGGSLTRPASFCGVAAFKPSIGALSTSGVFPFAPSFDTVGAMGTGIDDAIALVETMAPPFFAVAGGPPIRRLQLLCDRLYEAADDEVMATREFWTNQTDLAVTELASPVPLTRLLDINRPIVSYEVGRQHRRVAEEQPDRLSPNLLKAISDGWQVSEEAYFDALAELGKARAVFWSAIEPGDALVLPPAPHAAPRGFWSGEPSFATSITVLGGPLAAIPFGQTRDGRPLGMVVASRPGSDTALAAALRRVAP